ncbi:MAG: hypothetical protein J6P61_01875 [Erysipelotrichaceae bacterium]|nr:hypothetical protein [Erysipelotrichaceae bacterium]
MTKIIEYKCPACGGALAFDSHSQKLKCPYCDSEYDVETFDPNQMSHSAISHSQTEEADPLVKAYVCQSCAGEILTDINTGATICPYCGNKVIVPSQFEGKFEPEFIVPFQFDRRQAKDAYREHMEHLDFIPDIFKADARFDEITGLYVPFWVFDVTTEGAAKYNAVMTRSYISGDFNVQETRHFVVNRHGKFEFNKIPADASRKMNDQLMDSLEPISFFKVKQFERGYMAGYYASRYDVSEEECRMRIQDRINSTTKAALDATVTGYSSYSSTGYQINILDTKGHYALYPVWILNVKWNNDIYTFAMNGETGKLVGSFPFDQKAFNRYVLIHGPLFALFIFGLMMIFMTFMGG